MISMILFIVAFACNFSNRALNIATLVFIVLNFLLDVAIAIARRD